MRGALGSLARYALSQALPHGSGGVPWGTLTVNLVGSFVLGLVAASVAVAGAPSWVLGLVATLR